MSDVNSGKIHARGIRRNIEGRANLVDETPPEWMVVDDVTKATEVTERIFSPRDRRDVLDHGYVRLVDSMGSDLSTVNAARVSYDKASEIIEARDKGLINFLAKHGHTSPFRHAFVTFEVYAPLMVARQWWKYIIGSDHDEAPVRDPFTAWNESSRRYITEEPTFYVPKNNEWRSAPENSKQGSGEALASAEGFQFTSDLLKYIDRGVELYDRALRKGVATEQARLFLPAYGLYVRWRWSASLQGVCHFLAQRLPKDAQKEIQLFAGGVSDLVHDEFEHSVDAWLKNCVEA